MSWQWFLVTVLAFTRLFFCSRSMLRRLAGEGAGCGSAGAIPRWLVCCSAPFACIAFLLLCSWLKAVREQPRPTGAQWGWLRTAGDRLGQPAPGW